jgi:hypothetical protein
MTALHSTTDVTLWWSTTAPNPVIHLRADCTGLERTAPERVADVKVPALTDIIDDQWPDEVRFHPKAPSSDWLRPCRVCCLEPLLVTILGTEQDRAPDANRFGPQHLVSFTSQPAQRVDDNRFRHNKVSESGRERLERIAAATGLHLAPTSAGPAAWGFVGIWARQALQRNLRTVVLPFDGRMPTNDVISVFWALFDGVQRGDDDGTFSESWNTAWALA